MEHDGFATSGFAFSFWASGAMKRGVPQTVEDTLGLNLSLPLQLSSLPPKELLKSLYDKCYLYHYIPMNRFMVVPCWSSLSDPSFSIRNTQTTCFRWAWDSPLGSMGSKPRDRAKPKSASFATLSFRTRSACGFQYKITLFTSLTRNN